MSHYLNPLTETVFFSGCCVLTHSVVCTLCTRDVKSLGFFLVVVVVVFCLFVFRFYLLFNQFFSSVRFAD